MTQDVTTSGAEPAAGRFFFVGNNLAIDLVNTEVISGDGRVDLLGTFDDVLDWLGEAGIVGDQQLALLRSRWDDAAVAAGHETVLGFRGLLRAGLEDLVGGRGISDNVLDAVNRVLAVPAKRTRVVRTPSGAFATESSYVFDSPADVLAEIGEAARDLLSESNLALVRKCRNPRCILYFYDSTKNHRRSWCSMSLCGNRTKVAAHYRRRRSST